MKTFSCVVSLKQICAVMNNAKVIFQSGEQVPVDDKILPLDWTELAVIIPEVAKQQ